NQGTNAAPALWYDSIYLSDTPTLDASSTRVATLQRPGQAAVAGGASYSVNNVYFTLPPSARDSTRYLLFVTGASGQQAEGNEANNVKAVPFSLAPPDLTLSSVSAPASVTLGLPFQVTYTVTNQGTRPAPKLWTDAVYISDSPTLDASAQF